MNRVKSLDKRVAIVTGGARGLGRAMGLGLLAAGASVILVDVDEGALDETVKLARLHAADDRTLALRADVSRETDVQAAVDQSIARFGAVDVLVNNAGVTLDQIRSDPTRGGRRYWDVTPAEFRRVMEINTLGFFLMTVAVLPSMLNRRWGRVLNITTSLDTMWRLFPYGGSKAASEANTVILARDLAGSGVTANILVPGGPADTRLTARLVLGPDRYKLIPPEVMIPPLLWLVSDEANEVNGRRFVADKWDVSLPAREAAEKCGAPAAWQQLGLQARRMV
jgi:NAD(P)-dependent dehydrogenase (short-subunit alcohol dehydrogenase family)